MNNYRVTLLKKLMDARFDGSQAEFARAIEKSPAQVHHWITGYRTIGDATARNIEIKLGLNQGYFNGLADLPVPSGNVLAAPALTPRQQALLGLFDGLTASQQDALVQSLEKQKQDNDTLFNELTQRRKA